MITKSEGSKDSLKWQKRTLQSVFVMGKQQHMSPGIWVFIMKHCRCSFFWPDEIVFLLNHLWTSFIHHSEIMNLNMFMGIVCKHFCDVSYFIVFEAKVLFSSSCFINHSVGITQSLIWRFLWNWGLCWFHLVCFGLVSVVVVFELSF